MILDEEHSRVIRVPAHLSDDVAAGLAASSDPTTRRGFLAGLAAGGAVIGATVIALPSAAAAASVETTSPMNGSASDATPGEGDPDTSMAIVSTTSGDGSVTLTWNDSGA